MQTPCNCARSLQGVSLSGQRGELYRGVAIESVHLRSEAIQVKVAALIRRQGR